MSDLIRRPLLPYQQSLAQCLGVSEEEMLELQALQRDPSLDPAQAASELRMDPIVVGITLMVVGSILQVVGALLTKPATQPKQRRGRRSETFAPRYGFSSAQELAKFGDPINLVYTNRRQNPAGAVRIATSLVWSSIESFGTTQYMQLLLLIGAARVQEIDVEKVAFGQLPVRDFGDANVWIYYNASGGPVRFNGSKLLGLKGDPARDGAGPGDVVHRIRAGSKWADGFSQAFSPTTMTACGAWAPIPINVDWMERGSLGRTKWTDLGITLKGGSWGSGSRYTKGDRITIKFEKIERKKAGLAKEAARDAREQLVSNLDVGGTYLLGSARFRLVGITENVNLQENNVEATLECIEGGRHPTSPYGRKRAKEGLGDNAEESVNDAVSILSDKAGEVTIKRTDRNSTYDRITFSNRKQDESAPRPRRSAYLPSDDISTELGEDSDQQKDERLWSSLATGDVIINAFGVKWSFAGTQTVSWINDLDERQEFKFPRGGSIKATERAIELFLANKPKLLTKKLRKEYRSDLEKARALRDEILSGEYDKQFRKEARALVKAIREIDAEIERRIDERLDAEEAFEENNDLITSNEKKADKIQEEIDEERDKNNPDKAKIKKWKNERDNLRDENRRLKRGRDTGDRRKKKFADMKLKDLKEIKADLESDDIAERKKAYVRFVRNATSAFTGINKNRYAAGIKRLTDLIDSLKGEFTTDQAGVNAVVTALRQLLRDKYQAFRDAQWLARNWETLERDLDDSFYVRALCREEEFAYQTVTACNTVKLNLRVRVWRRISGRDKKYGEKDAPDGYKRGDNGYKRRMMFFTLRYRDADMKAWQMVPTIFCVQRAANQDNFVGIEFESPTASKWEFKGSPVVDPAAEFRENGQADFTFIENAGRIRGTDVASGKFKVRGFRVARDWNMYPLLEERGPIHTNEWDLFSTRSDSQLEGSFQEGPEMTLTSVTEQQRASIAGMYPNMSMLAFHVYAGKGIQDLRSVTVPVLEGKDTWTVDEKKNEPLKSSSSTSYGPDIFADTVLSKNDGLGRTARPACVNWEYLGLSKRFCKNNGLGTQLFMDGVFSEQESWRDKWAEIAPYSLLEFGRIGGQDTLMPAIPCREDGRATTAITITAAFNQGNIMPGSMKESWLDYGDTTRDIVATAIYRETRRNEVFPRNNTVTLCLADANLSDASYQTFDLSEWVSTRLQAELYLRLLCRTRRLLRRTMQFKTVPTDSYIIPGSYVVVDTGKTTWDSISSGIVEKSGQLNLPLRTNIRSNNYSALLYKSGQKPVSLSGVAVEGTAAPALAPYEGWLVVLGSISSSKSVFRLIDSDVDTTGEVTLKLVEHPVKGTGNQLQSLVADLSSGGFKRLGLDSY
jgi:hypothetical protein